MRLGIQTILWGPYLTDPQSLIRQLARSGFGAIELAQHPDSLLKAGLDPANLRSLLMEEKMIFLGLTVGSIEERMAYCAAILNPAYYYVETAGEQSVAFAREHRIQLALHAHVFKPTSRIEDAKELLDRFPDLFWIPDCAHQYIAGDNPLHALALVPWRRMPTVHIKDWTSVFSRSSNRYPRGFCDLGEGEVPVSEVVKYLSNRRYEGYLVVEQDYPEKSPYQSLVNASRFLTKFGFNLNPAEDTVQRYYSTGTLDRLTVEQRRRIESLRNITPPAVLTLREFYNGASEVLTETFGARKTLIWSANPTQASLTLVGAFPHNLVERHRMLARHNALSSIALDKYAPLLFSLHNAQPGAPFGRSEAQIGLPDIVDDRDNFLLAIPVFSPYNHNHERLLLSVISENPPPEDLVQAALGIGEFVVHAADNVLAEGCMRATNAALAAVAPSNTVSQFAQLLCRCIMRLIDAEAVGLFVEEPSENVLIHAFSTSGLNWHCAPEQQFYTHGEGLIGRCWKRIQTLNTARADSALGQCGKSSERAASAYDAALIVPLPISPSKAVGVLRCRNKLASRERAVPFSDDDAAVVEAAATAVSSQLQMLLSQQQSRESLVRLTHELLNPLNVVQGAIDEVRKDMRAAGISVGRVLKHDYLGDIRSYTSLFSRLARNINFFGLEALSPDYQKGPFYLLKDIVAPTVTQLRAYLHDNRVGPNPFTYEGFDKIPKLWIGKHYFQQIVFNLMTNAIKYAFEDPRNLSIEIAAERRSDQFLVHFSDWGVGVPPGFEEAIFRKHVRAPGAAEKVPNGQGLGLWIVRRLVGAHGGSIRLSNRHLPTKFTIELPGSLEFRPPGSSQ